MTVSSTQVRQTYTGNGTTTAFAIPFAFYATADIQVLLAGAVQNSGYSITGGVDSGGNPNPGTCTFGTAPSSGVSVILILNVPLTQLTALANATAFQAPTLNQVFDRAIQAVLRQSDLTSRSIRAPDADLTPSMQLPAAASRLNTWLGFDGSGNVVLGTPLANALTQALFNQFASTGKATFGAPTNVGIVSNVLDLGSATSNVVNANAGGGTINSFGTSANISAPIYLVLFSGQNTITNAGNIELPGNAASISTADGDACLAVWEGGGWQILAYWPVNGQWSAAYKGTTTSRASTTTLTADPNLGVALVGGTYEIEGMLAFNANSGGTNPGIQIGFSYSGTATGGLMALYGSINSGAINAAPQASYGTIRVTAATLSTATVDYVVLKGTLVVTTAGNYSVTWAQDTSSTTDTNMLAGSYIKLTPISAPV